MSKIESLNEIQLACDKFLKKEDEALMDFCKKLYFKSEQYLLSFLKVIFKIFTMTDGEGRIPAKL